MKEYWFPLMRISIGSAAAAVTVAFAFFRRLEPEKKYAKNSKCRTHIMHITFLYVAIAGLVTALVAGVWYLRSSDIVIKSSVHRQKPTGIPIKVLPISSFADTRWIWDHGIALEPQGSKQPSVAVVEHEFDSATIKFQWVLKTAPGFNISVRAAYKVSAHKGPVALLEPLVIDKGSTDEFVIEVYASTTFGTSRRVITAS